MRQVIIYICFLLTAFLFILTAQEPINNETVLKLVKSGISEDTIVRMINEQPGRYSLTDEDITTLKTAHVPEKVIAAMIVRRGEKIVPLAPSAIAAGRQLASRVSPVARLQDVRTIYVLPMEGSNADVADMVSAKLVSHLAKRGRGAVVVVESPEKADAVLLVTYVINSQINRYGTTLYQMSGSARLTTKDDMILWADDISNSHFARSASSSFAENVAAKLVQAIFAEDQ